MSSPFTRIFARFLSLALVSLSLTHTAIAAPTKSECLAQLPLTCIFQHTINAANPISGTVIFTPVYSPSLPRRNCRVRVRARISGLSPGMHGFHIHTYGDVSVDTGTAAGGHFADPRGSARSHGYPDSRMRHWGDFGNLVANDKGVATFDVTDRVIRLRGIVGRGMIIHAGPDMGPEAQPSGGAGAREAQCVIGIANPASVPA